MRSVPAAREAERDPALPAGDVERAAAARLCGRRAFLKTVETHVSQISSKLRLPYPARAAGSHSGSPDARRRLTRVTGGA